MARSGAGLLVQIFEQVSFGVPNILPNLPETRAALKVAPLVDGVR